MIDLGQTEFRLAVRGIEAAELESISNKLFDRWEEYIGRSVSLADYSLFLQVDEGSINGWGKIKSTATAFFLGVSAYGGVHYGIETISKQLGATRSFLAEQAMFAFACPQDKAKLRKGGGAPGYLKKLFSRVQRGDITPEEATLLAERMLVAGGDEAPGLLEALSEAFRECPRQHEQILLPFEDDEDSHEIEAEEKPLPKPRKPQMPDLPPLKYRVEVWRESRKKRKQSKVSPL